MWRHYGDDYPSFTTEFNTHGDPASVPLGYIALLGTVFTIGVHQPSRSGQNEGLRRGFCNPPHDRENGLAPSFPPPADLNRRPYEYTTLPQRSTNDTTCLVV